MKKYKVTCRVVADACVVEVEAETPQAAREKTRELDVEALAPVYEVVITKTEEA